jgi:hypothetical protein
MGVAHGPLRRRHGGKGRAVPERPPSILIIRRRAAFNGARFSVAVPGHARQPLELQEHLAQADRHMAELKARIARQRLIIGRTLAECRRLLVAKSTLQALEGSLHKFGEHCELILDQLKRPPSE